jgi:hypothetical protein
MSVNQSFLATACRKLSVFLVKKGVICKLCDIFEFHCSPSPASSHLPDNCWTAAAARLLLLLMLRCCWALNGCLLHACTPDAPPTQILCICSWTKRTHAHARAHTHTHTHTHVSNMLFDSSLSNMHVHTNAHTCTHTHTHVSNPKSKSTARACFSPEGVRNPNEGCVHGSAQCAHLTGVRRNARISGKRVQAGRQASEFRVVLAGQQFGANWSC